MKRSTLLGALLGFCATTCLLPEFEKSPDPQRPEFRLSADDGDDDGVDGGDGMGTEPTGSADDDDGTGGSGPDDDDDPNGPGGAGTAGADSAGGGESAGGRDGEGGDAGGQGDGGGTDSDGGGGGSTGGGPSGGGGPGGDGGVGGVSVPEGCGDGIVQQGEDCDDGNDDNDDACTERCQAPSCGDGFVQTGEECDDGNTDDADDCSNDCLVLACEPGCFCKERRCATLSKLVVGQGHQCALSVDSDLWCWGANGSGQTGQSGFSNHSDPRPVTQLEGVIDVDVGATSSCAALDDGTVWCWGLNDVGQLGNGATSGQTFNPVQVLTAESTPLTDVGGIASGRLHHCAFRVTDGSVWCWGSSALGRLGTTDLAPGGYASLVQQGTGTLYSIARLAAGDATTYAGGAGDWYSWGQGSSGQTGQGDPTSASRAAELAGGNAFANVDGGESAACGVAGSGALYCWGSGAVVDPLGASQPLSSPGLLTAMETDDVAVGTAHACVVRSLLVQCWGENGSNQLGGGPGPDSEQAVQVDEVADAVEVDAGAAGTCARSSDRVWCWGGVLGVSPAMVMPMH